MLTDSNRGIETLPAPAAIHYSTFPTELTNLPQWVCWRYEDRGDKRTKAPIDAKSNGRLTYAKSSDAATWASHEEALAACERHPELAGVGFCFAPDDGLTGIDLDHVIDPTTGELSPDAAEIVERFKGTYAEVSPSGTGLRLFCFGKPGRSGKNVGKLKWCEVYAHPSHRYLTVTGSHWPGSATEVTEQQDALNWLHKRFMTKADAPTSTGGGTAPKARQARVKLTDDQVLEKARKAHNGDKFARLWEGDTSGHGDDDSGADLALCDMLAKHTGYDREQMDRLFRLSGLMREKWDSPRPIHGTYGWMTIAKALTDRTTVDPDSLDKEIQALEERLAETKDKEVAKKDARELIRTHAGDLFQLHRQDRENFVFFKERLRALSGYKSRDFQAIIQQAGKSTGGIEGEQLEWLKGYAVVKADDRIADLATGNSVGLKMFDLTAEKEFPNGWGKDKPSLHLARSGAEFPQHECYYPGEARLVTRASMLGGPPVLLLNLYNPAILPAPEHNPELEELFCNHIRFIAGDDEVFVEAFLDYLALLIQKPGERVNWIPLFIAPHKGTGRGLLLQIITALVGKSNAGIVTSSTIGGNFHDALIFKQLIAIDEVRMFEDSTARLNEFKSYVTEPRVTANRKGKAQITVDNVANFIAFSNYENALAIDRDERRYMVATCYALPKEQEYYSNLANKLLDSTGGIAALLYMLQKRDLSGFNPKAPAPETTARQSMIDMGMTPAQRAFAAMVQDQVIDASKDLFTLEELEEFIRKMQLQARSGVGSGIPSQYCVAFADFKLTPHSVRRLIDSLGGIPLGQKRIDVKNPDDRVFVYAIRNVERWRKAKVSEIRDHLNS